jgi:starch phosphorylase
MENEWPVGDETTWKTALQTNNVAEDDVQGVANTVVRHVTSTLARQAANMDNVSTYDRISLDLG